MTNSNSLEMRRDHAPLILGAALFIQTMDAHALATILPAMVVSLKASLVEVNVAISSYYVGAAVFLPVSGFLADRFGARRVYLLSLSAFTVFSAFCGLVQTVTELALARGMLGASTAGMLPIGRLILIRTSSRSMLVKRLTFLTIPPMFGPLVGPFIAGVFATYLSWRLTFLIGVPMGLIGILLVARHIPELERVAGAKLDTIGALLVGASLAAGVFVLEKVGRSSTFDTLEAILAVVCLGSVLAYAFHVRRTPRPILDFSLLRIDSFRAGVVGGFFFAFQRAQNRFFWRCSSRLASVTAPSLPEVSSSFRVSEPFWPSQYLPG